MLSVVNNDEAGAEGRFGLDEICREGARTMLAAALEAEVDAYLAELVDERDEDGHRLVTRNGHARSARSRLDFSGWRAVSALSGGRAPR